MDLRIADLEALLTLPGHSAPTSDTCVLTCGCLASESEFHGSKSCPVCGSPARVLAPIAPLRELHGIVQQLNLLGRRRKSSQKRNSDSIQGMDLLSLFCKFAKEEADPQPIAIRQNSRSESVASANPFDLASQQLSVSPHSHLPIVDIDIDSSTKEYNFSRCFPFHRKLTTYPTQQLKFSLSLSSLRKLVRYIALDIWVGAVVRFVLVLAHRWELYELRDDKPALVCCGKLSGEFGPDWLALRPWEGGETTLKNDFGAPSADTDTKRLSTWEHLYCKLSGNYLVISGTKGVMRVYNVSAARGALGQPVYTYTTSFPIRCVSISPNEQLVACSITARERLSGKEQPFVIVHHLDATTNTISARPITITVPYRDPIKIISFNAASTHIVCCTVWELRYLVIKLRNRNSSNYQKPRLVWTELRFEKEDEDDNELMMDNEGITDAQFGVSHPNIVVISLCSLKDKPTVILRLDGHHGDTPLSDTRSQASHESSVLSKDGDDLHNIKAVETLASVPEVGLSIHRLAMSPRGDGMVFLDKLGNLFLVLTPNFQLHPVTPIKKVVVLLGEVANAERFTEAASVKFSSDGGRVYAVDRKGVLHVYDFTKGIPGEDPDVVKCKIIAA